MNGNEVTGDGLRTAKFHPGVATAASDSVKIVYNAQLDLPPDAPKCCGIGPGGIDAERSYLYVRENSIESNVATKMPDGSTVDYTSITYYDQYPFADGPPTKCGCLNRWGPQMFCCAEVKPKVETFSYTFTQTTGCCKSRKVTTQQAVVVPFEKACMCMSNRDKDGNPKLFYPFTPAPYNAAEFAKRMNEAIEKKKGGGAPSTTVSDEVGSMPPMMRA